VNTSTDLQPRERKNDPAIESIAKVFIFAPEFSLDIITCDSHLDVQVGSDGGLAQHSWPYVA
jgi:hypothetical protein